MNRIISWKRLVLTPATSALAAGLLMMAGCEKKAGTAGRPTGFASRAIVMEARLQPVTESLSLVGSVVANEMVEIKSETDGTVQEILFAEGQPVKAGELLVKLDDSKFAAAAAEAEANFKVSQSNYDRTQKLLEEQLVSQQEFDRQTAFFQATRAALDLRQRQLKDTRIFAPFAGIASARRISPGQVIDKNTMLTALVDLDPVKVELTVPERFVGQLKVGQKISVKIVAFPGRLFEGEVYFVAPYLNTVDRTALIKARIPNPQHDLKPGMFANVDLTLQVKEAAVVVPESAVLNSGDRTMVYVVDAQNIAQIRPVALGIRLAGKVEILSGLKSGELVVAEGLQKVRPGGTVQPVTADATGPEGGRTNRVAGKL